MKVLVIGSGGREHAICYKLSQSPEIEKVYVAPGNAGMKDCAELVSVTDFDKIAFFAEANCLDFVFIGPEQPLAEGLSNLLRQKNIKVVGPSKLAAEIESSKVFAKNLMKKYNIPTATFESFDSFDEADQYLKKAKYPQVLKADGLAAGKGVIIAEDYTEAKKALKSIMLDKAFAEAGNNIVIEEFLTGYEASVFAFCDGDSYKLSVYSQDHKAIYDEDKGPNTGGMGAYAPVKIPADINKKVENEIIKPTLDALKAEGRTYTGILFAGLMICADGPKVIEFNCRFGDPETEVVLPLLKTDFAILAKAICDKQLKNINLEWHKGSAVTVVLASKGYPASYKKGFEIKVKKLSKNAKIYFAGVKQKGETLYTNGGRVLMLTTIEANLKKAIEQCYKNIKNVSFDGMYYRTDIGYKGLK